MHLFAGKEADPPGPDSIKPETTARRLDRPHQVLLVRRSFFEELGTCATQLAPDFNPQNCSNAVRSPGCTGLDDLEEENRFSTNLARGCPFTTPWGSWNVFFGGWSGFSKTRR